MKSLIIGIFIIMCLAQWAVPIQMILQQEETLSKGQLYKFKTAPVDPTDPFRGSYITLRYELNQVEIDTMSGWNQGDAVYIILDRDDEGFATISYVSADQPTDNSDYFKAKVHYVYQDAMSLTFPFERFYLEESKASKAEREYWRGNQADSSQTTYALVRIKNGETALEDVMINGRSLLEIVRDINEKESVKEKP